MGQAYKRTVHCEQAHFWHMHDPYTTLAESVIAAPKHPLQPASGTRIRSPCALAKAAALLRHLGRHTATHAAPQAPRALLLAMAQREILEKSISKSTRRSETTVPTTLVTVLTKVVTATDSARHTGAQWVVRECGAGGQQVSRGTSRRTWPLCRREPPQPLESTCSSSVAHFLASSP